MASLLAKFRIDYSDVIVIPDVTKKAGEDITTEFKTAMRYISKFRNSIEILHF